MIGKCHCAICGNVHRLIFEHNRPFGRVINAFPRVGGVVITPSAGHGLAQVNDGVAGDVQHAVRAIAGHVQLGEQGLGSGHQGQGKQGG